MGPLLFYRIPLCLASCLFAWPKFFGFSIRLSHTPGVHLAASAACRRRTWRASLGVEKQYGRIEEARRSGQLARFKVFRFGPAVIDIDRKRARNIARPGDRIQPSAGQVDAAGVERTGLGTRCAEDSARSLLGRESAHTSQEQSFNHSGNPLTCYEAT